MIKELEQLTILAIPVLAIFSSAKYANTVATEFLFVFFPQYLSILWPSLSPLLFLFFLCLALQARENSFTDTPVDPRIYFDLVRFLTTTQTTICIFLCDFSFWDSRLSKNDHFSIGHMDLGIGCYMFNAGIVSCMTGTHRRLRGVAITALLGVLRVATVRLFGLGINTNEYGTHWNFYFTLSAVNLLFICLSLVLGHRMKILAGVALLAVYEGSMARITQIIFNSDRNGLFLSNKEGLLSIVPFLGLFLILNSVGCSVLDKNLCRASKTASKLLATSTAVHLLTRLYSTPSRRVCNLGYLTWILVIQFGFISLVMRWSSMYPNSIGKLALTRSCSRKMLEIFLTSNLLVLLFKQLFDLGAMSFLMGNLLNFVYILINFVVLPLAIIKRVPSAKKTC